MKQQNYITDSDTKRAAEIARALGHPARIAILKILANRNTCFCGDIAELLPLAQSTISQHLKALKSAGLISGTVSGVRTCYCLRPEGVRELQLILNRFSNELVSCC